MAIVQDVGAISRMPEGVMAGNSRAMKPAQRDGLETGGANGWLRGEQSEIECAVNPLVEADVELQEAGGLLRAVDGNIIPRRREVETAAEIAQGEKVVRAVGRHVARRRRAVRPADCPIRRQGGICPGRNGQERVICFPETGDPRGSEKALANRCW